MRKEGRERERSQDQLASSQVLQRPVSLWSQTLHAVFMGTELALGTPKDISQHQLKMAFSYSRNSSSAGGAQRRSDLLSVTLRTQRNKMVLHGLGSRPVPTGNKRQEGHRSPGWVAQQISIPRRGHGRPPCRVQDAPAFLHTT